MLDDHGAVVKLQKAWMLPMPACTVVVKVAVPPLSVTAGSPLMGRLMIWLPLVTRQVTGVVSGMFVAVTVMVMLPALLKTTSGEAGLPVGGCATGWPATLVTASAGWVLLGAVTTGAETVGV